MAIASVALFFFLPLMIFIAALVRMTSPGPILFSQERIGRYGVLFRCLKFRSMSGDADAQLMELLSTDAEALIEWSQHQKLRRDPRVTRLGQFLRKSSLDELPQLLNVLRGEMSLVGPRPIVEAEAFRYGRYLNHYCRMRPGITGLWQISGRNNVSYRRRVALDVTYIRSRSVWLYVRILALTIPSAILREGSY